MYIVYTFIAKYQKLTDFAIACPSQITRKTLMHKRGSSEMLNCYHLCIFYNHTNCTIFQYEAAAFDRQLEN